jgi:hypothetical protein
MSLISIVPAAVADRMRPRRAGWRRAEAWTASCSRLIHEQGNALTGSDGPSLIDIGESADASHTSPDGWFVFSDRSDKPIGIDPIGDREFGSRLSCDGLRHGCTRNSDCGGVHADASASRHLARGTSSIAVESAGKAIISITARNAALPAG